jgi:hypothetical protein
MGVGKIGAVMENEAIANIAGLATMILIPVALIGPKLNALQGVNRIGLIWALALAPVLSYLLSCLCMPLRMNIRVDLLIIPPLLLFVLVNAAFATYKMRKASNEQERKE